MDVVHETANVVDHNRYTIAAAILIAVMVAFLVGCPSVTPSLITPDSVTRTQFTTEVADVRAGLETRQAALVAEIAGFNSKVEAGYADLQEKDMLRTEALAIITETVQTYLPTPFKEIALPLITLGSLVGALGLGLDNRRKDQVNKALKQKTESEGQLSG